MNKTESVKCHWFQVAINLNNLTCSYVVAMSLPRFFRLSRFFLSFSANMVFPDMFQSRFSVPHIIRPSPIIFTCKFSQLISNLKHTNVVKAIEKHWNEYQWYSKFLLIVLEIVIFWSNNLECAKNFHLANEIFK